MCPGRNLCQEAGEAAVGNEVAGGSLSSSFARRTEWHWEGFGLPVVRCGRARTLLDALPH